MCSYNANYNRCRQFTPPGWGTAMTLAPCDRFNRSVAFRATEYRPQVAPIIIPSKAGMNTAKDETMKCNQDPCHGRNFCPPSNNQTPINVTLKMCQVPNQNSNMNTGQQQMYQNVPQRRASPTPRDSFCEQCPNTCPLPRCPPGVKVERTLPIIPARRLQESYFKMPNASVYKTDYVPREGEITQSFAPARVVVEAAGEFQTESLTKYDFKPHPVCPYKKPPWAFRKPREESNMVMGGTSFYKTDYVPKQGKPAPSAKPERWIDPDPPAMENKTVYQVEFIPRELPAITAKMTTKQMLSEVTNTCVPFDGLTVYKRDYIPKRSKPAESIVDRDRAYAKVHMPMDGTTTYKTSYGPFYFDDIECIPAELYDSIYPPKDKCYEVRCYPEGNRELDYLQQPAEQEYCPTPYENLCSPKLVPCVPPMKLKKENNYDGSTTISIDHNVQQECQEPIEYICPAQSCKPSY